VGDRHLKIYEPRDNLLDNCIRDQAVTNARQLNLLAADRCRR